MDAIDRLSRELDQKSISLHRFVEILGGAGYLVCRSTLGNYLHRRTKPTAEFLATAAIVLNVRKSWLVFGDLPRTEVERVREIPSKAKGAVLEHLRRELIELRRFPPGAQEVFVRVAIRYARGAPDAAALGQDPTDQRFVDLAGDLLFLLMLPLQWRPGAGSWGFKNRPDLLPPRELDRYLITSLQALDMLIPDPGEGDPLDDRADSLLDRLTGRLDLLRGEARKTWKKASLFAPTDWPVSNLADEAVESADRPGE